MPLSEASLALLCHASTCPSQPRSAIFAVHCPALVVLAVALSALCTAIADLSEAPSASRHRGLRAREAPAATAAPASYPRHAITDSLHRRCHHRHLGHMVTTIAVAVTAQPLRLPVIAMPLRRQLLSAAALQCHHSSPIIPTPALSSRAFCPRLSVIRRERVCPAHTPRRLLCICRE